MNMASGKWRAEISDVIEQEQEERVIELVKDRVGKTREELRSYFEATDSIVIDGLSREEAGEMQKALEDSGVSVRPVSPQEFAESEPRKMTCPACGSSITAGDWRCPECYHEFSDYEFQEDD